MVSVLAIEELEYESVAAAAADVNVIESCSASLLDVICRSAM